MKSISIMTILLAAAPKAAVGFVPVISENLVRTHLFENQQKSAPAGHDVPKGSRAEISPKEMKIQAAFAEHQQNAAKLSFAEDVRTLVQYNHGFAVISTNSKSNEGYPNGSDV
jgi:hypothetical protein